MSVTATKIPPIPPPTGDSSDVAEETPADDALEDELDKIAVSPIC
jgi:hypothetical protein